MEIFRWSSRQEMKIDYYAYRSGMKKWNTEFKMIVSLLTICFIITSNHKGVSIASCLVMSVLITIIGKLPMKIYIRYLSIPILFMLMSSLMIAMDFRVVPTGTWNFDFKYFYLCLTRKSIVQAVNVFLKGLASVSSLYMMVFSTPMGALIFALQKLHIPQIIIELMHLIYRYIFLLLDIVGEMQIAAKARLGYRNQRQGLRTFSSIASNLLLIAMQKANTYYDAMLARGYDGKLDFLVEEYPLKRVQMLGAICFFGGLIMIEGIG